jgi:predicted ATPase/DNA-binding SARP family transcriptional activator
VELRLFGQIEANGSSGPVRLTRAKERALLAALALFHGRVVSTDRLADAVWADGPPVRPKKALQVHVQRLRAVLGDGVVETHGDGYALVPGVVVDAELFEREIRAEGDSHNLRQALARWKDEPYLDLGLWAPAELERTRLAELRDQALETCLALEIEAGAGAGCIAELEAMVADKPLRERRWFLLMTALSRDGRVADALRAYQRARKVFATELGIDPGPELRTLEEQILLAEVRETLPGNLPRQLTSFVGREGEIVQLAGLVRERPLVTLTGVGGVGKTRLALETAARVLADFPDGAWLCELAPLADPDALWETLATSLGVRPSPGRSLRDLVLDYLGPKRLLVVLDNCEHLLTPAGRVADAIVQSCPAVAVLATSREGLALSGEQIVAVPPLRVPPTDADLDVLTQTDAARLFCDRARDVNGTFRLTERNAAAVGQLCRRLDGIPLAIELAAARVRSLSVEDLVDRLDQRLRVLTKASRSAPQRHQTLRATIDWSYDMLSSSEQLALNRLSVFAGGCDLAAAEAVVVAEGIAPLDVVDLLSQLVDKSLVEVDVTNGTGRYRLLETIRHYGQERLEATDETARVRDRHLAWFVALAEEAGPHLRGSEQLEWAAALARDTENIRTALNWALEAQRADEGLRLVVPLGVIGLPTGWTAADWPATAIAIPGASRHPLYPLAAAQAALGATLRMELDHAATLVASTEDAQARLDTHHPEVHTAAGLLALYQGDLEHARGHTQTGVDLARATRDPYEIAGALTLHAFTLQVLQDPEAAVVAEEAVRISRDAEIPSALFYALILLIPMIVDEQPARAQAVLDEAADLGSELGDRLAIATVVGNQAGIAAQRGDWYTALRTATDAAEQVLQVGNFVELSVDLTVASVALAHLERLEPAAVFSGLAAARFPTLTGNQGWEGLLTATDQLILDRLGATRTEELKAHGATLTTADAVAYLRRECDGVSRRQH